MARFPVYQKNILALGRLLANAATDPDAERRLKSDPAGELRRAGLPETTVSLFNFKVSVTQTGKEEPVVIPWRLNQEKLAKRDPEYLTSLADSLMSACGSMLGRTGPETTPEDADSLNARQLN
ncbi:hypothetical protein [Roseibium litorale]|uniref:Uncharacterized protein n=1 Tax=Roseibium litorale TaxID=2803841 RepID=A0ABR9CGP4_9HYPH|nr:hypothetical protein [Roseibium litorale]MBD8889953.1 hypothetical protein [Roseibium litorale]